MTLDAIPKFGVYLGLLLMTGAIVAYGIVGSIPAIDTQLRRLAFAASWLAVVALIARAWTHTEAVFGYADSWSLGPLRTVAIASRWGHAWRWQLAGAVTCTIAFGAAAPRRVMWLAAACAVVAFAWSVPLTGHAAGSVSRTLLHTTHIIAAGLWLGTLALLMAVRRSVDAARRRQMFQAFSAVAFVGAAVVVATGATASYLYVESIAGLFTTAYGRVLTIKLAFVATVAVCGFVNWQSIRAGAVEPARAARIEMLAALAIVIVTSVLTELAHP